MSDDELSRRLFMRGAAGTIGASWLMLHWPQIVVAADHAQQVAIRPGTTAMQFFTPEEAACVDAISAQIIPTDETPGAREAGVVHFIDAALATFFAHLADGFRAQLARFREECAARYPQQRTFAALSGDQQIEFLRAVEHTSFFSSVHTLTIIGMFTSPAHGGNRDRTGWKLLGFEDQHIFAPPFGYYDRDYPGFGHS
jgi:gluconate 2-dehydrogenase gamma chain